MLVADGGLLMPTLPSNLRAGHQVRVIAPSRSRRAIPKSLLEQHNYALAESRLRAFGLELSSGAHTWEEDLFGGSSPSLWLTSRARHSRCLGGRLWPDPIPHYLPHRCVLGSAQLVGA